MRRRLLDLPTLLSLLLCVAVCVLRARGRRTIDVAAHHGQKLLQVVTADGRLYVQRVKLTTRTGLAPPAPVAAKEPALSHYYRSLCREWRRAASRCHLSSPAAGTRTRNENMNLTMSWVERIDEGTVDLIAKDNVCHKVASLPDGRKDLVLRQKAEFTAIVAKRTAGDGTIDWAGVAVDFQAHLDPLLNQ